MSYSCPLKDQCFPFGSLNSVNNQCCNKSIRKAFDKVWYEEVLFKLSQNGISGNLLKLLTDFLKNRKQRVTLNGQTSFWTEVNAGVPQGSILGPLLFLIYINDLPDGLSSNLKLFAFPYFL